MFIKRKKYNEKMEAHKKEKDAYEQRISELHQTIHHLRNEKSTLSDLNQILQERIEVLETDNKIVIKTNEKLTEWLNKVLNEVGVYEVKDKFSISIPIYKPKAKAMYGNVYDVIDELPNFMSSDEIIIPEIRFIRKDNRNESKI